MAVISFPVHDIAAVLPPGGTWISLHRMFSGSFSSNFACQLPEPQPLTPGDGVGECAGILPLHLSLPTFHTSAKKGALFPAGGSLLAGSLPVTHVCMHGLCTGTAFGREQGVATSDG